MYAWGKSTRSAMLYVESWMQRTLWPSTTYYTIQIHYTYAKIFQMQIETGKNITKGLKKGAPQFNISYLTLSASSHFMSRTQTPEHLFRRITFFFSDLIVPVHLHNQKCKKKHVHDFSPAIFFVGYF